MNVPPGNMPPRSSPHPNPNMGGPGGPGQMPPGGGVRPQGGMNQGPM